MARAAAVCFICLLVASQASAQVPDESKWPVMFITIIAVHLGNTNSCVSGYTDAGEGFKICIPSWVALADDGGFLVGAAAKIHGAADPQAAAFGFKRLLGLKFYGYYNEDIQRLAGRVPYKIVESDEGGVSLELRSRATGAANRLHVSTAVAMVVAQLKSSAEAYLGLKVHDAVVTVPYYFGGGWDAAMDAAEIAGLTTSRIIDESTAAAVSHGIHKWLRNEGNLLVLHVGGGTTDASVLRYHDGVFEGCGCESDLHLGGDNVDQRIMDHFVELIHKKHGLDIRNYRIALGKLRIECERAKKELSTRDVTHVTVPSDTGLSAEPLTRAKLEELNHDFFQRIVALVDKVEVRGNKLSDNKDLIDEVLLVGGSAKIPMIQHLISNYFEAKKPITVAEPDDESVVYGGPLLEQPHGDRYKCMGVGGRRQYSYSDSCCPRITRPHLPVLKPLHS